MAFKLHNLRYAAFGLTTVYYTDGSSQTLDIQTTGEHIFNTDERLAHSVITMGQSFALTPTNQVEPSIVNYPNGVIGTVHYDSYFDSTPWGIMIYNGHDK